jgi:hypothetical protein
MTNGQEKARSLTSKKYGKSRPSILARFIIWGAQIKI